MTKIKLETPTILANGLLQTDNPINGTLQNVKDQDGNISSLQISNTAVAVDGDILKNFSTAYQSGGSINITSANSDDLNATVYAITGAFTIDIDDTVPDGFSLGVYQVDANQCTITASGTLTLRNRLGHTQTAGQYAIISLVRIGLDLVLTGDTA